MMLYEMIWMILFKIAPEGTCILSSKTASDVGGLNTGLGLQAAVHHFDMKPMLGES